MSVQRYVVAGTDTGVGKTMFAAGLAVALGAYYWKPIQAGLEAATDAGEAVRLGVRRDHVLAEVYRLTRAMSPHRAAQLDGVMIDPARLKPPDVAPLVIELAGGLMVPLTRQLLQIDLVASWQLRVILVARTALGTINHSLLSLEALRKRGADVHGIAFVGDGDEDAEMTICEIGRVRRLGRLPLINVSQEALANAFHANFCLTDFI